MDLIAFGIAAEIIANSAGDTTQAEKEAYQECIAFEYDRDAKLKVFLFSDTSRLTIRDGMFDRNIEHDNGRHDLNRDPRVADTVLVEGSDD